MFQSKDKQQALDSLKVLLILDEKYWVEKGTFYYDSHYDLFLKWISPL